MLLCKPLQSLRLSCRVSLPLRSDAIYILQLRANTRNFIGLETDRFIAEAENASAGFEFGSKTWATCKAVKLPHVAVTTTMSGVYLPRMDPPDYLNASVLL